MPLDHPHRPWLWDKPHFLSPVLQLLHHLLLPTPLAVISSFLTSPHLIEGSVLSALQSYMINQGFSSEGDAQTVFLRSSLKSGLKETIKLELKGDVIRSC